jgi:hypothetical protein
MQYSRSAKERLYLGATTRDCTGLLMVSATQQEIRVAYPLPDTPKGEMIYREGSPTGMRRGTEREESGLK